MASGSGSLPWTVVSSPNRRLKTLASNPKDIEEIGEVESGFETKGKQHMPATNGLDSSICCGICWSGSGKAIRGFIDSCDHYFCFVCIMEWARIESRCPLCKRRFAAIRRPCKDGVFPTERVVPVPERNQVSYLYGVVAGNRSFDPFAQVECTVCHGSHDESLLLLCDLCDSASHTFCVGLGATVPEGDWFCHDCSVSRTEHDSIQPDNCDDVVGGRDMEVKLASEPRVSMNEHPTDENNEAGATSNAGASVSIHDVVHEEDWWMPSRWRKRKRRVREVAGGCKRSAAQAEPDQSTSRNQQVADDAAAENGARTLTGCRNVHTYIRSIRENWDALRAGSLRFSSTSTESSYSNTNAGQSSAAVLPEQNCLPSSNAEQHGVPNDSPVTAFASQETQSDAIDKAWKMMLRAKSVQLACQRGTTSMQQVSKCPSGRVSTSKEFSNRSLSMHFSRNHQLGTKECQSATPGRCELHCRERTEKQVPSSYTQNGRFNMEKRVKVATEDSAGPSCSLPAASSSPCTKVIHKNPPNNLSQKIVGSASKNRLNEQNGATCLSAADAVVSGALQTSASTPTKADAPNKNVALHKACAISDRGHDDEAKTEIQSLVKLNLKFLSRDKHLGVERFKEVARGSTHTILAACGLEHSKRAVRPIPSPVCKHTEDITECSKGKATPIPNCCRDCFLGFVKKVVKLISSEKHES